MSRFMGSLDLQNWMHFEAMNRSMTVARGEKLLSLVRLCALPSSEG